MSLSRISKLVLAIILLAIPLACLSSNLTKEKIIGEWVEKEKNGNSKDTPLYAVLCFSEQGDFTGHNIPEEYFSLNARNDNQRIDIFGKWELDLSRDISATNRIHLDIDPNPQSQHPEGYFSDIFYDASIGGPYIYVWGEDENDRLIFEKTEPEKSCSEEP